MFFNIKLLVSSVAQSGVVNSLLSWADFKQSKELKKTDGIKRKRITGIPKLEDANDAGGRGDKAGCLPIHYESCEKASI